MIIGYQAVYDLSYIDAIDYAKKNKFDFVSFDLNVPRFYIDQLTHKQLKEIREYSEKNEIAIAFHAPGDNISLFTDYPSIRNGILEHFTKIINAAEALNARHITLHPGIYPSLKKAYSKEDDFSKEYEEYFSRVIYENVLYLQEVSKNTMLCLENYNLTEITMNALDSILKDANLFLTWDIAKTYDSKLNCNAKVEEYMFKNKNRIKEIHIHDIIKDFRSHQRVGSGGINFKKYHEILNQSDIAITIEVRPREEALISRENLMQILGENSNES